VPGTLTAIAYDASGERVSESSLESVCGKRSIRVKQERQPVMGQPVYVDIDIVGENGVVECNMDKTLTVTVEGAELLGFGSANPKTTERFESGTYTTYYGRSQAVLLPQSSPILLTVTAEGMDTVKAEI
ncbi:MAG: glycoside hydrolase family 2 protein, partial [Clostridia bacterium]|nr:glycoside hydrolase family 2 protein [Clostridia bacterium]